MLSPVSQKGRETRNSINKNNNSNVTELLCKIWTRKYMKLPRQITHKASYPVTGSAEQKWRRWMNGWVSGEWRSKMFLVGPTHVKHKFLYSPTLSETLSFIKFSALFLLYKWREWVRYMAIPKAQRMDSALAPFCVFSLLSGVSIQLTSFVFSATV